MSYHQLTENERYQIYALMKAGHTQKQVAYCLKRSPATISRELDRNRGLRGYRPKQAQERSDQRRHEAHKCRKIDEAVRADINTLIKQDLSPQQVADYLYQRQNLSLHHETIYQFIYRDKAEGGNLYQHLRIASKPYRKRYGSYDRRGKIPNRTGIEERPTIVDSRRRIGDWEGDTIIGKGRRGALLTLLERKTLYTIIVKLDGKNAEALAQAAISAMTSFKDKIKTITFDNGLEFAAHEKIAEALEAKIYFAHPYCSWERGANENVNGLIRQYFPKGTDFNQVSEEEVARVMKMLNSRPRATRGCKSPNELFLGLREDLLAA
jgi:transposase, IS30 family